MLFIFALYRQIFKVDGNTCTEIYYEPNDLCNYRDVAIREDGLIYISRMHDILLNDPGVGSTKIYEQPGGHTIRRVVIRRIGGKEVLYFSVDKIDRVEIFQLKNDVDAVLFHTLHRDDLMMPDPCNPGDETPSYLLPSEFTFDRNGNLFVSNGNQVPCGFFQYSNVGENGVTGDPERIHVTDYSCWDLDCTDDALYYLNGKDIESESVTIRKINLLASPHTNEVVYSSAQNDTLTKNTYGFSLIPHLNFSSSSFIKWLQKMLNIILEPVHPLVVDGIWGPKTKSLLKRYQSEHQLRVDGVFGEKTWGRMLETSVGIKRGRPM